MMAVPQGWLLLKLSEVGEVVTGNTPSTDNQEYYNGNIPFIGPIDFKGTKYINDSEKKVSELGLLQSRKIPKNSIMTVCIGSTIGKNAIVTKESCTNQQINSLVCSNEYHSEYIFYAMNEYLQRQLDVEAGLQAVPIVNKSSFSNLKIPVPPKKEQQKIAEILSGIDRAIEATQTLIDKEKMIKKGLMADLLYHGIDEEGRIRTPQTHRYIESPLGMIPEGWEVIDMEELVNITTGNRDTQDSVEHGLYPFIVRSQTIERINSYAYDGEAILTAGDGVGVGKVFHFMNGKFDFHQRVYCLSKFDEKIDSKFLFEYFRTYFIKRVNKYSAKGSVDSVRYDMIAKMPVPIPSKLEQQKIAQILSAQDRKIETEEANLVKLQNLKKALMADLLSGKVRVKG